VAASTFSAAVLEQSKLQLQSLFPLAVFSASLLHKAASSRTMDFNKVLTIARQALADNKVTSACFRCHTGRRHHVLSVAVVLLLLLAGCQQLSRVHIGSTHFTVQVNVQMLNILLKPH
jgi:hypothetical protein